MVDALSIALNFSKDTLQILLFVSIMGLIEPRLGWGFLGVLVGMVLLR